MVSIASWGAFSIAFPSVVLSSGGIYPIIFNIFFLTFELEIVYPFFFFLKKKGFKKKKEIQGLLLKPCLGVPHN